MFEKEFEEREVKPQKVLAIDLCPSVKRLEVGVLVSKEGEVSKPIYFKSGEVVRKIRRIRVEG